MSDGYTASLPRWEMRGAIEACRALRRDVEPDGDTEHAAMFDVIEDSLQRADRALADCVSASPSIEPDADFEGLHRDAERIGRDIDSLVADLNALNARASSREHAEVDAAIDGARQALRKIRG